MALYTSVLEIHDDTARMKISAKLSLAEKYRTIHTHESGEQLI